MGKPYLLDMDERLMDWLESLTLEGLGRSNEARTARDHLLALKLSARSP